MFALLVDEDFDGQVLPVIERVARRYEVPISMDRVVDIGTLGAGTPDPDILRFAAEHDLVVITHDHNTMPAFAYQRMQEDLIISGLIVVSQFLTAATVAHAVVEKVLDREESALGWHYQIEWV